MNIVYTALNMAAILAFSANSVLIWWILKASSTAEDQLNEK